jgi:hypothetical protein
VLWSLERGWQEGGIADPSPMLMFLTLTSHAVPSPPMTGKAREHTQRARAGPGDAGWGERAGETTGLKLPR